MSQFPTWWSGTSFHSRKSTNQKDDYTLDYMYHAIHDAEMLLHQNRIEQDGHLPWQDHEAFLVIPGPFRSSRCFYYDPKDDEWLSVSSDEILTPDDILRNWPAVEAADRKEVMSFVQRNIFKLAPLKDSNNTVDGTWVRKWADRSKGLVKSRCCGRGFLLSLIHI